MNATNTGFLNPGNYESSENNGWSIMGVDGVWTHSCAHSHRTIGTYKQKTLWCCDRHCLKISESLCTEHSFAQRANGYVQILCGIYMNGSTIYCTLLHQPVTPALVWSNSNDNNTQNNTNVRMCLRATLHVCKSVFTPHPQNQTTCLIW